MPEARRPSVDTIGAALPLVLLALLFAGLALTPAMQVLP